MAQQVQQILSKIHFKLWAVFFIAASITVILGAAVFLLLQNNNESGQGAYNGLACSNPESTVYAEAKRVFGGSYTTEYGEKFNELQKQITSMPEYEKDPNCLYAMITYNLITYNSKEAQSMYDKFTTVEKADPFISDIYGSVSIVQLKNQIDTQRELLKIGTPMGQMQIAPALPEGFKQDVPEN